MKNFKRFFTGCLIGTAMSLIILNSVALAQIKEIDKEARTGYQKTRETYQKEANFFKNTRQQFLEAQKKYQQFKNVENKSAYEDKARAFLEQTIKVLIKKLETLNNWVSNRRGISETEKQGIIAEIDKDITWLSEREPKTATASASQIKESAKEIREYWKAHQGKVKRLTAQALGARIDYTIEKFEKAAEKISAKIQELKAAGKDTSQLESWLNDFKAKIDLAKAKYQSAREKYQAISDLAEADKLFKEAQQFIKEADSYLREANQKLREIVKEIKKLGSLVTTEGTTE